MNKNGYVTTEGIPRFDRDLFGSKEVFTCIGSGGIGGKAKGLANVRNGIRRYLTNESAAVTVDIPKLTVIGTDMFDRFMEINNLYDIAYSDSPDDRIAHAFIRGEIPAEIAGDLRGLIEKVTTPLAVRSSSLLEDAMYRPFAGVYGTKMIPNNLPDIDSRFKKLVEAVKFVYASTYFREAKAYVRTAGKTIESEKMAVIIQEVVGNLYDERFYPTVSGVARSYNFYPFGHAAPQDGVIILALGLGKTIVDGGKTWSYAPSYPQTGPPFGSATETLRMTQSTFWAVNMAKLHQYDPIKETEYLVEGDLKDAEMDNTLRYCASTYQPENDRIVTGTSARGPRLLNFAPLIRLHEFGFNDLVARILKACEEIAGTDIEIEFAFDIPRTADRRPRFGFLQVRPMVVAHTDITVTEDDLAGENTLLASSLVMGNGSVSSLKDIVYVKPETFDPKDCVAIARELELINTRAEEEGIYFLLIGFGRWGSSDPWLGIPVNWSQISRARVMVESTLPQMNVELSQGSHFFHNMTSFEVLYFAVSQTAHRQIDWDWLNTQQTIHETDHVKHVRAGKRLDIRVDGKTRRGVITYG